MATSVEREDDEDKETSEPEPDTRIAPLSLRRYDEKTPKW
jgi:hypothetical protein